MTTSVSTRHRNRWLVPVPARSVVIVDAALEAAVALACLVLAVTTPERGMWQLASWLTPRMLAGTAAALAAAAVVLWLLARRPVRWAVGALGTVNLLTAAGGLWWAGTDDSSGPAVRGLAVAVAVALAVLGTAQIGIAARR